MDIQFYIAGAEPEKVLFNSAPVESKKGVNTVQN